MENKILSGILIIAIILAIATIIYVDLEKNLYSGYNSDAGKSDNKSGLSNESYDNIILNVIFGDANMSYTLEQLISLEAYNGSGRYIKTKLLPDTVVISEAHYYTGVRLTTLLDQFDSLPENYTIIIHASDGWTRNYTWDQIHGRVSVYNESGYILDNNVTATIIIAYSEDGEYYVDKDLGNKVGPLRLHLPVYGLKKFHILK